VVSYFVAPVPPNRQSIFVLCAGRFVISRRRLRPFSASLLCVHPPKARSVLQRRLMPCCLDQGKKVLNRSLTKYCPGYEEKETTKRRQTPAASVPPRTSFPVSCLKPYVPRASPLQIIKTPARSLRDACFAKTCRAMPCQ